MEKTKLELTKEQIQVVLNGLAKLPFEVMITTWNEIQLQLKGQVQNESQPPRI